jgi:hypothetical protein
MTKPIKITASGVIMLHSTIITEILLTAGSANATLTLRQETVSGEIKTKCKAQANESFGMSFSNLEIKDGVYAELSGTGAEAYVYYN